MTHRGRSVVVGPGEGATIEGPVGGPLTFKVRGEESGGSFTALENVIPPGQGPPFTRTTVRTRRGRAGR